MGKMHRFEETRRVRGKTPQQCFDWLADVDNATTWVSSASEVRAEGELGEGRRIIAKASLLGVSMTAEQEVEVFDPPHRYAYSGSTPFHIAFDFRFDEQGDDTEMTAVLEVDPGKFFPVGGFVVARAIKKMAEGDINTLAKKLEQQA